MPPRAPNSHPCRVHGLISSPYSCGGAVDVRADARVSSRSVVPVQEWHEALPADLEANLDRYLRLDAAQSSGRVLMWRSGGH